jgi:predicted ATPase
MELADEFIRSVKENDNEFLIETHSEHLLLRIMKRMRQTAEGKIEDESLKLTPDDVCLLYVDNDEESTNLQELRLSVKGTLLDHWPHGFFEEGYKERFS